MQEPPHFQLECIISRAETVTAQAVQKCWQMFSPSSQCLYVRYFPFLRNVDQQHNSLEETSYSPVKSFVIALFCLRAEQISSSQGGRNSWWQARSSAMVLGEPGEDRWSPSPSWQPSSIESTNRNRDCWGGFTFRRGKRTHLGKEEVRRSCMLLSHLPVQSTAQCCQVKTGN